jgi:glutamate-1-semialdehyde 2,1-aminomutase
MLETANYKKLDKGIEFKLLCEQIIPAGSSTLAKSPNRLCRGYSPFYADYAKGCHFWDIDGNEWLDCEMAMGSVVWGHCREEVDQAIIKQLHKGINFSVPSTLEYELALKLLSRYPQYEAVKYFKNGADAVYAAVRSARRLTGKEKTLSCEYHGWLDWSCFHYYRLTPELMGIPKYISTENISCECNIEKIIQTIYKYEKELACIVLCPANYKKNELAEIMDVCRAKKSKVIFDEITSGMRFARGGATQQFELIPDYLCISKGVANGLPLAITLGKKENILIMEELKISNAHTSELLSLSAAIVCEELLSNAPIWPSWGVATELLRTNVENVLAKLERNCTLKILGNIGCLTVIETSNTKKAEDFRKYFISFLSQYNIFTKGYIIFCDTHSNEDIQYVCDAICSCIKNYTNLNS